MFSNARGNRTKAYKQAKANAKQSGVPWVIYTDTSGNVRICRQSAAPAVGVSEIVSPRKLKRVP